VVKRVVKLGGVVAGQRGSHAKFVARYPAEDGTAGVVQTSVPMHPGDIPTGTLRKIERDLEPAFGEGWLTR
jgi:predicted RNA binding protein YcfA (HicA-like mRNA interferase family)